MPYLSNGPVEQAVLRLMARKSFALGLFITDYNEHPLDITGCEFRLVVRKDVPRTVNDDSSNLVTNALGLIQAPTLGYLRFELQASDLDFLPGDYIFSITMVSEGFSTTIVNGTLELEQNTEFSSVAHTYTSVTSLSGALSVQLKANSITVRTGPTLAPGDATFTWADEQMLKEVFGGAVARGRTLNADMIADGSSKVMMTLAERAALADLSLEWADILNKPAFGDIITYNAEDFVRKSQGDAADIATGTFNKNRIPSVMLLNGISHGTGAPPSGNPNSLYLKHS